MSIEKLWQLHREGRDGELMDWARTVQPSSVADRGICELLGELFSGADQADQAILWYRQADTDVARQALPLLYLRQGDPYSAKSLLATAEVQGTEWHEARYLLGLLEDPTPQQRLDALGKLLEEQYLEPYMTEYAAVCLLAGQEKKGLHMAKRQLRLFPGGTYERQARMLLEEGVPAAQPFLSQLEAQRGLRSVQPYHASPAASFRDTSPHPDPAEEAAVPVQSLPEPVKRCFDGVVGMPRARQVLLQLYNTMQYQKSRQDYQLETRRHFHFLIRGAQGSGKSMLANRISAFLHELKAATDPAPCLLESYQLSGYLSGAGSELTDALAQCQDRTVIVDGIAPLFAASDSGAPLAKLFYKLLEPFQESLNLILIGTDAHIDRLLSLEPTAAGMFLYDIKLESYSAEQLLEITKCLADSKGYTLSSDAARYLEERLEKERQTPSFRNGKTLDAILNRAALEVAARMAQTDILSKGKLMRIEAKDLEAQEEEEQSLKALLDTLNGLTGLKAVKERVRNLTAQARLNQEARRAGIKGTDFGTLHMIFTGNPGTGKTTVARILGGIYCALGILPRGNKLVECGRGDLVGQYQGQTAPKVQAKVAEAIGGVLFIDEAYALCRDDLDTFGHEALDALVAEIENHRTDLMVILAGYSKDMDRLLEMNPGLPGRFPHRLEFEDYTQEEMEEIFLGMLAAKDKHLEVGCEELMRNYIANKRSARNFGNARGIRNLTDRLIEIQNLRLVEEMERTGAFSPQAYRTIKREDLEQVAATEASRGKSLQEWLEELNALTGLASVKKQVEQKANAILAQKKMAELHLGTADDTETLHMVFRGNPGTGKTTVARILGGIYNALGLLPSGDIFVECSRRDLVGEYQGHTAMKVKRVIDSALGGVLFIDEAYALCRDDQDSFGREAVDTLIADMENHRKDLMVILAGYSEDMDRFVFLNPGLPSRVPTSLTFPDYTHEEMLQIFQGILTRKGYTLPPEGAAEARQLIAERSQVQGFGNARGVRNLVERVVDVHNARIGERLMSGDNQLSTEELITVIPEDFRGV